MWFSWCLTEHGRCNDCGTRQAPPARPHQSLKS